MRLPFGYALSICILLCLLYFLLGIYAMHQRDALFTQEIYLGGEPIRLEKLRGFIELGTNGFDIISGGYIYHLVDPYGVVTRPARYGDSATYFIDTGKDYVVFHVEHHDYILFKYLVSFGALLFVISSLFIDYRRTRGVSHG